MIRKSTLFSAILLLQILSLKAQVAIAYINPNFQQINSKSFNAFANSYLAINGPGLSSYNLVQTGTGFTVGFGINTRSTSIILGAEYSRSNSTTEFNFANQARRYMSKHSNLLNFRMMIPVGDIEEKSFLGMVEFGAGIGKAVIKSGFDQGSTPINSEALDGKYSTIHMEVSGGLSLMYMFGPVGLKAGCTYNITPFSTRMFDDSKELDFDSLPQDYGLFTYNPSTYSGEEVKDDFRYLKFGLGVVVILQ
jgi:hypothetical protein